MVADSSLQNFVHQIFHGADHGNNAGRLRVRHVNLDLKVDLEDEAFLRLGDYLLELRIQVMCFADGIRPVQIQNRGRHDFRLVTAWVERILARAQGFLPNAAMAGPDQRTILEVRPGSVLRGQTNVGLDHGDLTLLDNQHGHKLNDDQERIERVSTVEKRVMLKANMAAVVKEGLEVLIVVVEVVLAAK